MLHNLKHVSLHTQASSLRIRYWMYLRPSTNWHWLNDCIWVISSVRPLKGTEVWSAGVCPYYLCASEAAACYIIWLMSHDIVYMFPQQAPEECLVNKHSSFLCLCTGLVFTNVSCVCHWRMYFINEVTSRCFSSLLLWLYDSCFSS